MVVLLTPGIYNSAYFEHSFLAQQMGIELVEGRDLVVDDDVVYMKTIHGLTRVDVIYRRIDDEFLDPLAFRARFAARRSRPDGCVSAPATSRWRTPSATAWPTIRPSTPTCPTFIKYYLGEDPILHNVETYLCSKPDQLTYVLEHLPELVVKAVGESGGYGMLMGPAASKENDRGFPRQADQPIRATTSRSP